MHQVPCDTLWFFNTQVTIRVSHESGADTLSVLEHCAPFGDSPPLHIHVNEDEVFHILEGEFRFRVGDGEIPATSGQWILVPKGVAHSYLIVSRSGGRWLTVTSHRDFERFVREVGRPARHPGLPEPTGPPTAEQARHMAEVAEGFGIRIVGPPLHETSGAG